MQPNEEAAAILNWYFRQLAHRAGLRWSDRNQADIERACELLSSSDEPIEELPPYQRPIVSDRVTQVFERDEPPTREPIAVDPEWEKFQRWRAARAEEERYEQTRRLVRRS
jgi:hypothetical protein